MNKEQFDATAKVVWAVLEPWLRLQYGDKCGDYEHGCESCRRWRLAEKLLSFEDVTTTNLRKEIEEMEDGIKWRKELLNKMIEGKNNV